MVLANQIVGFSNLLFLQNKSMKQPPILHVDTDSQKLKAYQIFFWVGVVKNELG